MESSTPIIVSDSMYADVITQFLIEQFPCIDCGGAARFEAISKEVFGTKQRRNGPMPSPEVQVKIREVLRKHDEIQFFMPWGARKQVDGMGLDLLELCALKQLIQLKEGLLKHGKRCQFSFRLEDLSDLFLFDEKTQIDAYINNFVELLKAIGFHEAVVHLESDKVNWLTFLATANSYVPSFISYLRGQSNISELAALGWRGVIPAEQRDYYTKVYRTFYPDRDVTTELARYFSTVLARTNLKATCVPGGDYIHIYFGNHIPGHPMGGNRLLYRSIPERFTHIHRPPWIGKGYLVVANDNECTPKSAGIGEDLPFHKQVVQIGKAQVECDYVLGD